MMASPTKAEGGTSIIASSDAARAKATADRKGGGVMRKILPIAAGMIVVALVLKVGYDLVDYINRDPPQPKVAVAPAPAVIEATLMAPPVGDWSAPVKFRSSQCLHFEADTPAPGVHVVRVQSAEEDGPWFPGLAAQGKRVRFQSLTGKPHPVHIKIASKGTGVC